MKNFLLGLMTLIIAVLLIGVAYAFLEDQATARQLEAEARLTASRAAVAQAQAELERASGERAVLEASAQSVNADRLAAHPTPQYNPIWGFLLFVSGMSAFVGMAIVVWQANKTVPHAAPPQMDWQSQSLYWQRLALILAAALRARATRLSVIESKALQAVDHYNQGVDHRA